MGSKIGDGENANIAASWPHIVNEQALHEASILPHLLHEAEEAQKLQSSISTIERNSPGQIHENINEVDTNNEEKLQNMIENYSKYVIRQKQQQNTGGSNRNGTGRSASHLQRKINAPQPTPMSHSHPCLFLSGGGNTKIGEEEQLANKRSSIVVMPNNIGPNQPPPPPPYHQNLHNQQHSDPPDIQQRRPNQQTQMDSSGGNGPQFNREMDEQNGQQNVNENAQLKQQNEKLQKKCDRLEQLEMAYRKIERDYEQMLGQQERREELGRMAMKKMEKQLKAMANENEQLRAQINLAFGQSAEDNQHFMLEMIPKNNSELLVVQMERQRLELEAQSATLEEQRRHIEVLEKALANAQERLAAKERSAVDAMAVVDKCTNLQKMLQEALEDKQRQKEQNGRQVAQLEMELTQLKLQIAKENNSQSALGSLGRKGGGTIAAGGASPESADEILKLRKTLAQKEERITQLEQSLMKMQSNRRFGEENAEKITELETRAMRLELEKAEKERRIQELLDEKMRIQTQWAEERRNLDVRVRMMEKELRHFVGSQSSLASSGGGQFIGAMFLPDQTSPFDSVRGQKSSPYLRHRSTAELPTSARGAALYEERLGTGYGGMDVMAKMEELGRKLAERRAKGTERTTTVQRPSDLGFGQLSADEGQAAIQSNQSHSSSSDQPLNGPNQFVDISPSSEDQFTNGPIPMLHRQSAPSSAGSSSKKRYLVNANTNQLAAYLEQLPEATRRRLTGDNKIGGGFHLLTGIEKIAGQGRREGGCRRLIRGDHSTDIAGRKQTDQQQMATPPQLAPPPNYQEAAAFQQRSPPTQLIRQSCPNGAPPNSPQNNANTVHKMSSIDEPIQEAPPPPPPAYSVNVVEVNGEEGDSDTLTGHKQLVFRRSSLGNFNLIAK